METVCQGANRTYIIIDGLDECTLDNRSQILNFFTNLMQGLDIKEPGKSRLLVVSQKEQDIKRALVKAQDLELRWENNRSDIEDFVTRWARDIRDKFELNDEQEDHIKTKTCLRAKGRTPLHWRSLSALLMDTGQFLYAELVVKNLHAQPRLCDLRDEIEDSCFPKQLSDA